MTSVAYITRTPVDRRFEPMTATCLLDTAHVILSGLWPEASAFPDGSEQGCYAIIGIVDRKALGADCLRTVVGSWLKVNDFGDEVVIQIAQRERVNVALAEMGLRLGAKPRDVPLGCGDATCCESGLVPYDPDTAGVAAPWEEDARKP